MILHVMPIGIPIILVFNLLSKLGALADGVEYHPNI